jgi:hypothetical protein
MSLKTTLNDHVKDAMRAGQKDRLAVLRLITAAIKQREVDELTPEQRAAGMDDAMVLATLEKMIKQRKESIAQFEAGNRPELAAKEQAEIEVIKAYLPAQLSDAEVDALVAGAIAEVGAASVKDMGKVMAILKAKAAGKADMAAVGAKVKAKLSA